VSEYGRESWWCDTATADAERARDLAGRLERRAKATDEVAARDVISGCSRSPLVRTSSTSAVEAAPSLARSPDAWSRGVS
jgi:hypothetical protein